MFRNKIRDVSERIDKNQIDLLNQFDNTTLFEVAKSHPESNDSLPVTGYSYLLSSIQIFTKNRFALIGLTLMVLLIGFILIQPCLPGQHDPLKIYNDANGIQIRNAPPSDQFILGTNSIGQDLWGLTWSGTRTSLLIGFVVACIEITIGVSVGIIWGYVRKFDILITEVYNIFSNVPQTLVLVLVSYVLQPGLLTIILALSLTGWLTTARYVRNQALILRDRDYNLASKCLGTPDHKIIIQNILPYLISIITMRISMAIPCAISNEVFVSYLGLGLPQNIPSLGNLISSGIGKMMDPNLRYQLIFPSIILCVITVSFYIVGNAFADACDPKNHNF